MKKISLPKSWKIFSLSIIVGFLASAPYLYGFFFPKEGLVFLGRSVINSADTYVYLSNIISAKEGKIILPNLYTTESKTPFFIKPVYYLLGFTSGFTGLEAIYIFHFARFILTTIFVFVLYKFIGLLIEKERRRFFTLFIVLFSSGIGFWVKDSFSLSIDLWVPEANTFFSLLEAPHFISSQIFLLLFIYFLYQYSKTRGKRYLFASSISSSLVILEHPFMTPFIFSFSLVFFLFLLKIAFRQKLSLLLYFLFLPTAAVGLIIFLISQSESARLMQTQNILPTPSFDNLVYGYGWLLPLALLGFYNLDLQRKSNRLLIIWPALTFFLVYLPFSFQRRLLEGVHIPLSILAAVGIFTVYRKVKINYVKWLFAIFLVVILYTTNLYNLWYMVYSFKNDSTTNYIYYLDRDEMEGMKWLARNSGNSDTILANVFYSNVIPGITGRFVYHGHRIQTFIPQRKQLTFDKFMKSGDQFFRQKFLKINSINYIYLGKNDFYKQFLDSFEEKSYLEKVWQKKGVVIFKVVIDTL